MSFLTTQRAYRKPISVSIASATLVGFQKKIKVPFEAGKMASDFSDLIFQDINGNNLPYWIENKTDGLYASVWVKLNTSVTLDSTIYMYYGASGTVTSPSSIDNTMDAGLRFYYHTGKAFNTFIGSGIDTATNYNWGSGAVTISGVGGYSDNLSIYWQGWIKPNGLGTTTFYCASDDGQRMYVAVNSDTGFTNIIDNWVDQGETERSANYNLQNVVFFQYNYYESGGGAVARIGWDSVNGGKEYPIPSSYTRCRKYLATEPTLTFNTEESATKPLKPSVNTLSKYRRDRFVGYVKKNLRIENTPLFNDPNLIGYWKLDGNSLASRGSINGTENAIDYSETDSYWGNPASFNGQSSYITVGDQAINANDFSLSCWVKRKSNSTTDYMFGKGTTASADASLHAGFRSSHEITVAFYGDDLSTVQLYSDCNSWHLVTYTYSYSTKVKKIYYDGVLIATGTGTGNPAWGTALMYFGYAPFSATTYFFGYITDVAVFNRVLAGSEISKIANGFDEQNNLKDYKRLEDNTIKPILDETEIISPLDISSCKLWIDISSLGLSDGNSISSAPDKSGNNNNLTQISAGQNPIYKTNVLNQLPIMRGTVASSSTFYIPFAYSSPTTIFYIARQTGGGGRLLSGRSNNWLAGYHGGYKNRAYYGGWLDEGVNRQATDDEWYVWAAVCNSRSYLYSNGSLVKQATTGVTSPSGLTIGYLGASEFSDFDIGEIIGYNRELSPREIAIVTNYLLKKWGLDYNVAFEKPAFLSSSNETHWYPTDGSCWTDHYIGTDGLSNVTVDLLDVYQVNRVDVFHYWSGSRTYYFNKVETSVDGVTWTTRFDSEVSGRYAETYEGKSISFTTSPVRYIRNTLNGSSANVGSHWVEIRAMGH